MSADPAQVLRILDIRGIDVRLVAGGLKMRRRSGDMPADVAGFIRHFKPLIVAELSERDRLAETVRNVMALSEADYRQWTIDVLDAAPEYEHDRHDRAALGQVRRLKQLAKLAREDEAA